MGMYDYSPLGEEHHRWVKREEIKCFLIGAGIGAGFIAFYVIMLVDLYG